MRKPPRTARRPARQPRLGPRLEPPIAAALRLARAYSAIVDRWLAAAEKIVSTWPSNPVAFGPNAHGHHRIDSAWTKRKGEDFEREVRESLRDVPPQIDLVAQRVSKKASDFFGRVLPRVSLPSVTSEAVTNFRLANLRKIKSLAAAQVTELHDILEEAERDGDRVETLRKRIQERLEVSRSKAELLARDQTLKLAAAVTKERQTQAGITQYRWSTSGDERVRPMHDELDDTIQDWDDPPVTNDAGDRNHPGEDYQCRCVAIPILPEIPEVEEDIAAE